MDTTLIPMNTAQIGNALTDLGSYMDAYFPAFLGLAMFFAAIVIAYIVISAIIHWLIEGIHRITMTKAEKAEYDFQTALNPRGRPDPNPYTGSDKYN